MQPWTDSTDTQVVPFAGALNLSFMPQWDLGNCKFATIDGDRHRSVTFLTHVEVTGDRTRALPEDAVKRLISMIIVSRLDAQALTEACESLIETFRWTFQPALSAQSLPTKQKLPIKPKIKAVESRPFEFEDE